jgi:hypothetical protein
MITGTNPAALKKTQSSTNPKPESGAQATVAGAGQASASPAPANPKDEGTEQGDPQAGAAVRRFHRGMIMQYGLAIYNARVDKATNNPQLQAQVRLFREGKPVFTGKESAVSAANQPDMKRLLLLGAIQLGTDMTPGEYVLQVVVTDLLTDQKHRTLTQWMDFEIVK